MLEEIENIISEITGFQELKKFFTQSFNVRSAIHRIVHYIPENNGFFAKPKQASSLIMTKIHSQLKKNLNDYQEFLRESLNGNDKAGQIAGALFESETHERLLNGGQYQMRSLSNSSISTIDIKPTIGEYSRFSTGHEVFTNIYQIPKASNFPSGKIDHGVSNNEKSKTSCEINRIDKFSPDSRSAESCSSRSFVSSIDLCCTKGIGK
jgi:hypothetical protein